MSRPRHGTAVASWSSAHGWRGVWITGPSGAGKSDLALRLISRGWRLVADDYACLFASGGALYAVSPDTIAGRIEARGVGVPPINTLPIARLTLVVALGSGPIERLPDPETVDVSDISLPLLRLDGLEASAAEKVALKLATL